MKKGSKASPAKSSAAKARERYAAAYKAWKSDQNNQAKEMAFFKLDPPPPPKRGGK